MALIETVPEWFTVTAQGQNYIEGIAKLAGTTWSEKGISLQVTLDTRPSVREGLPGTLLPRRCPERHIFNDSTFCMGLRAAIVTDPSGAARWWNDLAQYLMCQSVAEKTGFWPLHNGLDHGRAGYYHAMAIELAEQLGILDEYFAVGDEQVSGFSSYTLQRFRHSKPFRRLLCYERLRKEAAETYRFTAAFSETVCCGSMPNCPYPKFESRPVLPDMSMRQRLLSTTASYLLFGV